MALAGSTFRAFRERNFRLFYVGLVLSQTGSWAEVLAIQWLVYRLTGNDENWLGYVAAAPAIPALLLSIPAGSLIDRVRVRSILFFTQAAMMLASAGLALLVTFGEPSRFHLLGYAVISRSIFVIDAPARQTFVAQLVPKELFVNAIALNATAFNVARFTGAAAFGLVVLDLGEAGCIALNSLSFACALVALLAMRDLRDTVVSRAPLSVNEVLGGLRYAVRTPAVRAAIAILVSTALLGYQLSHLLPVYAKKVWFAGAGGLTQLSASLGVGALVGGLVLSTAARHVHRGKLVTINTLLGPLLLTTFALSPTIEIATGVIIVIGFLSLQVHAALNSMLQSAVPDHLRGRVMALFTLSVLTAFPGGGLIAGTLSARVGAPTTTLVDAGVLFLALIAVLVTHPEFRRSR